MKRKIGVLFAIIGIVALVCGIIIVKTTTFEPTVIKSNNDNTEEEKKEEEIKEPDDKSETEINVEDDDYFVDNVDSENLKNQKLYGIPRKYVKASDLDLSKEEKKYGKDATTLYRYVYGHVKMDEQDKRQIVIENMSNYKKVDCSSVSYGFRNKEYGNCGGYEISSGEYIVNETTQEKFKEIFKNTQTELFAGDEFNKTYKKVFGTNTSISEEPILVNLKYEILEKDGIYGINEGNLIYDTNNKGYAYYGWTKQVMDFDGGALRFEQKLDDVKKENNTIILVTTAKYDDYDSGQYVTKTISYTFKLEKETNNYIFDKIDIK